MNLHYRTVAWNFIVFVISLLCSSTARRFMKTVEHTDAGSPCAQFGDLSRASNPWRQRLFFSFVRIEHAVCMYCIGCWLAPSRERLRASARRVCSLMSRPFGERRPLCAHFTHVFMTMSLFSIRRCSTRKTFCELWRRLSWNVLGNGWPVCILECFVSYRDMTRERITFTKSWRFTNDEQNVWTLPQKKLVRWTQTSSFEVFFFLTMLTVMWASLKGFIFLCYTSVSPLYVIVRELCQCLFVQEHMFNRYHVLCDPFFI